MTLTALVSLQQKDDEFLQKFMDMFGRIVVHIQNLNPEVSLQSMLLGLRPGKFTDSLWKKTSSRDELHERAKDYIQMEGISRFKNEVLQTGQKRNEREGGIKPNSHK